MSQDLEGYEPVGGAKGKAKRDEDRAEKRQALTEAVNEVNKRHAVVLSGGKAMVLRESVDPYGRPYIEFLTSAAFGLWFANRPHPMGYEGTLADAWVAHPWRRQYEGIVFSPEGAPKTFYNLWRGFTVDPASPYPDHRQHIKHFSVLYDHVRTNIARGDQKIAEWVWAWLAHLVQRPTDRLGTSLVLRGRMGAGKTILGEMVGHLLGPHYILADSDRYLTGQFNAHLAACILLQIDEGIWAGDKAAEGRLKGLVTSKEQMIERKGVDPVPVRNLVRLMISSNNEWVVPAGLEERRFCVLDVGDGSLQNRDYFAELLGQMQDGGYEHMLAYLLAFDWAKVNPAVIPATEALYEQKVSTMTLEQSFWFDRLREGLLHHDHTGWRRAVPTQMLYAEYLAHADRIGAKHRQTKDRLMQALKKWAPAEFDRRRLPAEEGAKQGRQWGYVVPPLSECRRKFDELMRWPIDWGDGQDEVEASPDPISEGVP